MIVGTAGHIDHGKTTLVSALTGIDADRLPEEKKRGVSIELGYAYLDVPGAEPPLRIGFIDVPGHERLVHTMLAGATGIDFALLLVAADDGVMPQTREHLAVLSLLGLARGAVVITKCDLVEPARVDEVRAQAQALLAGTSLDGVPIVTVSAQRGEGIDALKALLLEAARVGETGRRCDTAFRLAVDRAFVLDGVGTVATGTVHAGRVTIGDELALVPDTGARSARVRGLHVHGQRVESAWAGQRCAISLAGIAREEIARGQWLTAPGVALASDRIDAVMTLWRGESAALRSGTVVHVHLGASDTLGTVAVLDTELGARTAVAGPRNADTLAPGATARVQLVLRKPIGAWHGDRIVLRDASATRTVAGGVVLDPLAPGRYRRTAQRLGELDSHALPTAGERLAGLLAVAPYGVDLQRWARAQGLVADTLPALPEGVARARDAGGDWALGARQAQALRAAALAALSQYHERQPDELGPETSRLRRVTAPRLSERLWRVLLDDLRNRGQLAVRGAYVHLPEHGVRLSASEERIAQKVAPALAQAGFEGAWVRDLAHDVGESEPLMRTTLARLSRRGELHQVVKDLYYAQEAMIRSAAIVRELASCNGGAVTAAGFRDRTGLGRKRAIQILEYFDRVGLLRRVGNEHRLRVDSDLFMR